MQQLIDVALHSFPEHRTGALLMEMTWEMFAGLDWDWRQVEWAGIVSAGTMSLEPWAPTWILPFRTIACSRVPLSSKNKRRHYSVEKQVGFYQVKKRAKNIPGGGNNRKKQRQKERLVRVCFLSVNSFFGFSKIKQNRDLRSSRCLGLHCEQKFW